MLGKREMPSRAFCAMYNFKGADQQKLVANLSGGEMNRLHLARTLKKGGNLLLLDEPTNDLDVDTLRALEEALLVRRLRRRHQPRPLVPRPRRDAHARVRGRQQGRLVRRQLPGLRGRPPQAPRRRGRPPAPDQVPEAGGRSGGGAPPPPPPRPRAAGPAPLRSPRFSTCPPPPTSRTAPPRPRKGWAGPKRDDRCQRNNRSRRNLPGPCKPRRGKSRGGGLGPEDPPPKLRAQPSTGGAGSPGRGGKGGGGEKA